MFTLIILRVINGKGSLAFSFELKFIVRVEHNKHFKLFYSLEKEQYVQYIVKIP